MHSKSRLEKVVYGLMRGVTYLIVLVIGYIIFDIARHGLPVMNRDFLTLPPSDNGMAGGIFPAIVGTACLVAGTIAVALPLGVACAVYLTEYAKQGRFTEIVRLAIITLAGVPSIVYGLFGLGLFVYYFHFGRSILAGSLTLACMVLPTIIVASEEALKAVPYAMREGSLALGATKWQTIYRNVLPYAIPGMLTGSILGIGRAAGETAPILLTAAAFSVPDLPRSVFDQVMALSYHLFYLVMQASDPVKAEAMQYGTAFVLLLLVLGVNLVAIMLRSHLRKKFQW